MWIRRNVAEACDRFRGSKNSLNLIGGAHRHVYSYKRGKQTYILKLYPVASKDPLLIETELKWMQFLQKHQIPTPRPIQSRNNKYIETITMAPLPFFAVSFQHVEGRKIKLDAKGNHEQLFRNFGKLMGKIHHLSQKFPIDKLPLDEWNEGELYHRDFSYVEQGLLKKWEILYEKIDRLPKSKETYGLILNDLHLDNCLLTKQQHFILYDFSKIKKHWYTYDIAIALHYLHSELKTSRKELFTNYLLSFIEGYLQENQLAEGSHEQIEFFMTFRDLFKEIERWVY